MPVIFWPLPALPAGKKNSAAVLPADAPLEPGADKSDLLYDIWLMANKPSAVIHKSNA